MFKNKLMLVILSLILSTLASCGGGGSSSGGEASPSITFELGNYVGTQTFTFTAPGFAPQTNPTVTFGMFVRQASVTIPNGSLTRTGPIDLNGNFTVQAVGFSFLDRSGNTCTGDLVYSGRIIVAAASGTISGNITCTGIRFNITGPWQATRQVG